MSPALSPASDVVRQAASDPVVGDGLGSAAQVGAITGCGLTGSGLTGRPSFCAGEQTERIARRRRRNGPHGVRGDDAAGLVEHADPARRPLVGRRSPRTTASCARARVERRRNSLRRACCPALKNIDPAPGPAEGGQRRQRRLRHPAA